jgi:hypothetical protein
MSEDRRTADEGGKPASYVIDTRAPKMSDDELGVALSKIFEGSGIHADQGSKRIEFAEPTRDDRADLIASEDAWTEHDRLVAPGGLFANLSPRAKAELEANLIMQHGERPDAPDPHDILRERTERAYSPGTEVDPGMAAMLDHIIDAVPEGEIANRTEATIRELGMAAHPELVREGTYGQQVLRDGAEQTIMAAGRAELARMQDAAVRVLGTAPADVQEMKSRVATSLHALKYLASVDTQRTRRDQALARLPARKAR